MEIVFKRWQCCIRRQSLDTYPYISTHIENITLKHTFWKMWLCRFRLFKSTEQLGSARTAHRKQRPSAQSFLRNEPPRFKRSARSEGGEMSDAAGSQSDKRGPAGCSVRPAALGQRSESRSRSGTAAPGRGHRRRARPRGRGRRGGGEREGGREEGRRGRAPRTHRRWAPWGRWRRRSAAPGPAGRRGSSGTWWRGSSRCAGCGSWRRPRASWSARGRTGRCAPRCT